MKSTQRALLRWLAWIARYRYLKFGIVGASGTVVNLVMLHIGHEYLFHSIEAAYKKPYASLALAITLAAIRSGRDTEMPAVDCNSCTGAVARAATCVDLQL